MKANELIFRLLFSAQHTFRARLSRDPEIRYLQSGSQVCSFNFAVNKAGTKRDDNSPPYWFKAEAWGDHAQEIADSYRKGDLVKLTGQIKIDRWTGNDGTEKVDVVLRVESHELIAHPQGAAAAPANTGWQSSDDAGDDEIPF